VHKLRLALLLVLLAPSLMAQDTKAVADELCHGLRQRQAADGSYGSGLADTCRVLDVLSRSPRRYTELDGPFMRNAARLVAQAPAGSVPDALVALALASSVSADLRAAREAALERLAAHADTADFDAALALKTLRPDMALPAAPAAADAALQCLLARDPSSIPAPPVTAVAEWTRWARAARLRGIKPADVPALPAVSPAAGVAELVAALETVIQMHGLPARGVPALSQADAGTGSPEPVRVEPGQSLEAALERSAGYLERQQEHGTFGLGLPGWTGPEPGVTALCLSAAMNVADLRGQPRPAWIAEGLDYLKGLQHDDGSIHEHGLDVYTTSVAIEALALGGREADRDAIKKARRFLLVAQADEGEGYQAGTDIYYGGVGYGNDERPDLSNLQFAIEAATKAGTPAEDPFFRKARGYLERCQNFSEAGAVEWLRPDGSKVVMGNDGGATYMPGSSEAGEVEIAPGIRQAVSYGSMTYSLVKSYLFCSVPPQDPRVQAAVRWLAKHFTLERNPGFLKPEAASDGLFYYYLSMARTLRMLPDEEFVDEQGKLIPWRGALSRHLLDTQRTDGSWSNDDSQRWWESAPTLCTAYAVLALSAAGSG
jgi:squalene-hopene/tetraprenyl-beta-curcumene cyclase